MKKKKIFLVFICCIIIFNIRVYAHSGRTDSSGGHNDNKNASGLGSYHYHCNGNPPHLHTNGSCPYSSKKTNNSTTSTTTKAKTIEVESIEIEEKITKINIGESKKISASITPTEATSKTIKWTTSDKNIISVDSQGNITAKKEGVATITASSSNGKTDIMNITVLPLVESITLTVSEEKIQTGQKAKIKSAIYPENAEYTINWTSKNPEIATVDDTGTVTAIKEGKVNIVGTVNDEIQGNIEIDVISEIKQEILENEEKDSNESEEQGSAIEGIATLAAISGIGYLGYKKFKKK